MGEVACCADYVTLTVQSNKFVGSTHPNEVRRTQPPEVPENHCIRRCGGAWLVATLLSGQQISKKDLSAIRTQLSVFESFGALWKRLERRIHGYCS
jgi:hypothetical protein